MGVYSFLKVDLLCHIPGSLHVREKHEGFLSVP